MELLSIIDYCNHESIEAILISYDFYKAFDVVSWSSLQSILEFFNFGPFLRLLIRILQLNIIAVVSNNNHWSDQIIMSRGLPQGSPVSSFLFVLQTQILASKIMQNNQIEGIKMNNSEKKLNQYADDLWTPILFKQTVMDSLMQELSEFNQITGLSINFDKTNILRFGALRDTDRELQTPEPLVWTNDKIKILGLDIFADPTKTKNKNYNNALEKLKSTLEIWKMRTFTPIGKIHLFNALCVSLLVYKFMALGCPEEQFFQQVKKLSVDFIWSGIYSKTRYAKVIQNYHDGGLKLCDIKSKYYSLKVVWVKKLLLANPHSFWVQISSYFFPINSQKIWNCNLFPVDVLNTYDRKNVWIVILYAWAKFNFCPPNGIREILDQTIWCNSCIRQNNKVMVNNVLLNQGLEKIQNLYSEQEGRFWTHCELVEKYNIQIDFLTHRGIISAIPREWKNQLSTNFESHEIYIPNTQKVIQIPRITKYVYNKILPKDTSRPLNQYWQFELKIDLPLATWENICYFSPKIALCPKLRYFQYRLLQKKLVTNNLRSKWDPEISPMCTFCQQKIETVFRIFCDCAIVIKFWKSLSSG